MITHKESLTQKEITNLTEILSATKQQHANKLIHTKKKYEYNEMDVTFHFLQQYRYIHSYICLTAQ